MPFPTSSFVLAGQFTGVRAIAQGASGQVYYAEDNLGRHVAVKEALPTSQSFQDTLARFEKESRLQARLDHPNIVGVYSLVVDPGTQERYLVCEYANGGSLAEHLETYGALTEQQAIRVTLDICAALELTSSSGVVHCDIKPGNIMLFTNAQGQVTTAKLGDFGVALERAAMGKTIAANLSYPGTPLYMAPEQANTTNVLDVRADIYALGITLFEMLTLKEYKLLAGQSNAPKLSDYNPVAGPAIGAVIQRAVQDDPRRRYQTSHDMAGDLRAALGGGISIPGAVAPIPSSGAASAPVVGAAQPASGQRTGGGFMRTALIAMLAIGALAGLYYLWRGAVGISGAASGLLTAPTEAPATTTALEAPATTGALEVPATTIVGATATQSEMSTAMTTASAVPAQTGATRIPLLQQIQARGRLLCGSGGTLPGFSYVDPANQNPTSAGWSGFDVDFCRALAVAIFGNVEAVEFVKLSNEQRFPAVLNGEVDVLFRNTTWTSQRDTGMRQGAIGLDFGPTVFYDGQGLLVRADSNINTPADLAGKTVCVASNTTTESNLSDYFRQIGVTIVTRTFSTTDEVYNNYVAQGCAAATSDRSQLFVKLNCARSGLYANCLQLNPDEHRVLPEIMSKEPLGPVVIENDSQWRDVVSWTIFAMIYGDELGVTQANVGEQVGSTTDRRIKVLLGIEGTTGQNLGLENDFAARVISEVGNYSDVYQRNFVDTQLIPEDPGPNKAWNKGLGGVLSTPPFGR